MDPLTASITVILGKYALDQGATLVKEVGPQALETAKEIFTLALDRLRQKPTGQVVAGEFEEDPATYEKPVGKELDKEVQADAEFKDQLQALLDRYEQAAQEYAAAQGRTYTRVQVRDGAVAIGEGSTALGQGAKQIQVQGLID